MKKCRKIWILLTIFLVIACTCSNVFAIDLSKKIKEVEYSKEFLNWMNLDTELKNNSIMPRMYNVSKYNYEISNPIKLARTTANSSGDIFNLKNCIPKNMEIKNQGNLGSCWAFAAIGSLETNLAMQNYFKYLPEEKFDFSEMHLEYATSRQFLNDGINAKGFNRTVGMGGSYQIASAYLTNGTGAINESAMPYNDSGALIDINLMPQDSVVTQVYDTTVFPQVTESNIEEVKTLMKNHIKTYGGIIAGIHEDDEAGGNESEDGACPNVENGALYCDNAETHIINHNVLIVGWDDNYSVSNFKENHRPPEGKAGAWIAKDSHGDNEDRIYTLEQFKEKLYEANTEYFNSQGINSASEITNEMIEENSSTMGYVIDNGNIIFKHNDDGYLYISYEDANVYTTLMGIQKSKNRVDYENIYQYDEYGAIYTLAWVDSKIYLANVFDKKTEESEYLSQVAIDVPETVTCKVYVNANGTSKAVDDLELVTLKTGESKTVDAGYHTLEFAEPIEINNNNFVVVIEVQGKREDGVYLSVECNVPEYLRKKEGLELPPNTVFSAYSYAEVEQDKCFCTDEEGFYEEDWASLTNAYDDSSGVWPDCDLTIKAFTVSELKDASLKNIVITKQPTKTSYIEGENFDKTGMVVIATYNNGDSEIITDYEITNGTDLQYGQNTVTISYEGKTTSQSITVEKNIVPNVEKQILSIEISKRPNKTKYVQNQDELDLTGGKLKINYDDNSSEEISLVSSQIEITGFDNTKVGENTITVKYESKTVTFDVEIMAPAKGSDFEEAKSNVSNIKFYTFSDANQQEYISMDMIINGITRNSDNDSYEYYYYISSNPNEKNIKDWVKIKEEQKSKDKLEFNINTKDIKNYDELSIYDTIYVYVKEVAKKGENQKITISNAIQIEGEGKAEIYVDNVKLSNTNINAEDEPLKGSNSQDETTAKKELPYTGVGKIIIFVTIVISVGGFILYKRYKELDKYVK